MAKGADEMAIKYVRRSICPKHGNKYFMHRLYGGYSNNAINLTNSLGKGSTVYNCVGYSWGRVIEMLCTNGVCTYDNGKTISATELFNARPIANACDIYEKVKKNPDDTWTARKTPVRGAIVCYSHGEYGHCAVVEKVYDNGNVDLTNCNSWTKPLWTTYTNVNPKKVFGNDYKLLGYIYNKHCTIN